MAEPSFFVAGDTVEWTRTGGDYPATAWTLTYYFVNPAADFSVEADADGQNYTVSIPAATSEDYEPGWYDWTAVVTGGDSERYVVDRGRLQVRHDPSTGDGTGVDTRSEVKIALDAIEAVLAGRATRDQESYAIAGRQLSRTPIADLIVLRNHYKREYVRELKEKRIAEGLDGGGKIKIRFR